MRRSTLWLALAGFAAISAAYAGQVVNPINAPASVASGDIAIWPGTNPQQTADSGYPFGTSGAKVGLLNGNNAYSGNDTFSGTDNFTGTFEIGGTTESFPASGVLVGTSDTQTLTGKSIAAGEVNSGILGNAQIPQPTLTALGGMEAASSVAHQWVSYIDTSGVQHQTQPAASDLSNGTTGSGSAVLATSPTIASLTETGTTTRPDGTTDTSAGQSHVIDAGNTSCNAALSAVQTSSSGQHSCGTVDTLASPGYVAGHYYTRAMVANNGSGAPAANTLYAAPIKIGGTTPTTFTKMAIYVVTGVSSTNCELGIYTNSSGQPSALVVDAGNVSTATSATFATITGLSVSLSPGIYWLALGCNGTPTLRNDGGYPTQVVDMGWKSSNEAPYLRVFVSWTYSSSVSTPCTSSCNLPATFGTPTYDTSSGWPVWIGL